MAYVSKNLPNIIGLIPAAGQAMRIQPLPCSKEIFPVGFRRAGDANDSRPKAACHCLIENMAAAGAEKAYIILRPEKWDIPSYLGNGRHLGLNLAYLITEQTSGAPFTLDQAFPFIEGALILFGFPDIIFGPEDAFLRLTGRQKESNADIVLGLYRANNPHKVDMVALDPVGRIKEIVIKPLATELKYTWIIAIWTSVFTRFMHTFLAEASAIGKKGARELYLGDVICAGIRRGLSVEGMIFEKNDYVDIGTPEDLFKAVKENIQALEGGGK